MGRTTTNPYVTPIKSDGTEAVKSGGDTAFGTSNRGVYTLEGSAAVYYVSLEAADSLIASLHTQGDTTIAITSITIEETNMGKSEVSLYSDNAGEWIAVDVARITTVVEGTGWTNTSDVVANTAGNAGGGIQTIADCGTRRMRARIVVGTGGQARFAVGGKD